MERVKQLHVLLQHSRQATFGWHQDHREHVRMSTKMITVVVLLRGSGTGMQVWGFNVHTYGSAGSAVAFAGAATHRSVVLDRTEEPVVKLTIFLD